VYVGVGAHVLAASPGGPRHDASQSKEKRVSPENGIHLCRNCAEKVDGDQEKYTETVLRDWKSQARKTAEEEHGRPRVRPAQTPLLQLRLLDPQGTSGPWTDQYRLASGDQVRTRTTLVRFYHLGVSNAHRALVAHNVQVFLTRIDRLGPAGALHPVWSGDAVPLRWRYPESQPFKQTVGPACEADLVGVMKEHLATGTPVMQIRVSLEHARISIPSTLTPYIAVPPDTPTILHLQARSDEADSEPLRVKVSWNGRWADEEDAMAANVSLEVVDA
jgi:hypothetical protein